MNSDKNDEVPIDGIFGGLTVFVRKSAVFDGVASFTVQGDVWDSAGDVD